MDRFMDIYGLNTTSESPLVFYPNLPDYILYLTVVSCILSLIGSLNILLAYIYVPDIQNFARKLFVYLTAANSLDNFGVIIGLIRYFIINDDTRAFVGWNSIKLLDICVFQALVTSYAPSVSFFWTTMIAFYIFMQVESPKTAKAMSKNSCLLLYHVIGWGLPAILCMVPLYYDVYGENFSTYTGPWCWIRSGLTRKETVTWMFVSVKGWEFFTYLVTAAVFMLILWTRYKKKRNPFTVNDASYNSLFPSDRFLMYTWLLLVLLRLPGNIRLALLLNNPTGNYPGRTLLMTIQSTLDASQAFTNFVCFFYFEKRILAFLYRCRCKCRDKEKNYGTLMNA
ncbi:G-protein coupled receptor 157-like [Mercenaria mercenaria]|uniref:G-protein coupled receptor 157-like n=1 Tax=Mercenaria mercenaria TaxID=6596 RepID=UPI00234F34C9|nr:G-protein coupled receptor 157-like [Mercenaria mercenaria]